MFAFAVWDRKEKTLWLCRDRVGVKPLYYGECNGSLIFGSELKALREFRSWTPEIDLQAMGEYLQYGYIAAPRTIYKGVNKLPPGHWLIVQEGRKPRLERYWSIQDKVASQGRVMASEEDLVDQLENLLIDAFKYRMVSDVPVGVFLSGGIDSSTVASILQRNHDQPIHTFTIGFRENQYDESCWAKAIAEYLGTRHTEFILNPTDADRIIPNLPKVYDEPYSDSSNVPTLMVSELAREHVKVALSADGGDELFGGYTRYALDPARLRMLQARPAWLRRLVGNAVHRFPPKFAATMLAPAAVFGSEMPTRLMRKWNKLGHVLPDPTLSKIFQASEAYWLPGEVARLTGTAYSDPRMEVDEYSGTPEEKMMYWDFEHFLPEDVLTKVDRATMSVGLEGREPLLDHRLAEFAFGLPVEYRMGEKGQKYLLKKVLSRYLPENLVNRPKQGFSIPLNRWMRDTISNTDLLDFTGRSSCMGLIDPDAARSQVDQYEKTGTGEAKVWSLFVLSQWMQEWN